MILQNFAYLIKTKTNAMVFLVRIYFCRWITVPQLVNAFYVITKNEIGEYEISQSKNTVTCSSVPSFVLGLRMRMTSL